MKTTPLIDPPIDDLANKAALLEENRVPAWIDLAFTWLMRILGAAIAIALCGAVLRTIVNLFLFGWNLL
jgi:hypothetical protein